MEFDVFVKTIHETIGNKSLYDFTIDLFEAITDDDLGLTQDYVKNWFRKDGKNHSYIKILNDKKFNDIKFDTFLKSRTIGTWKNLQSAFYEVTQGISGSLIDCVTDNHDKFIDSIEWQLKTILRIPINQKHIKAEEKYIPREDEIAYVCKKERIKIAKRLLKYLDVEIIAEAFEITIAEVEALKEEV